VGLTTNFKYRSFCEVEGPVGTENRLIYFDKLEPCDNGLWFDSPEDAWHINEYHSIMAFSGLTDSSGKDIYEGDVIKYSLPSGYEETGRISFRNGAFFIDLYREPASKPLSDLVEYDIKKDEYLTKLTKVKIIDVIETIKSK
jgi:hypothetical protein